jgi:glycosyltransferase involved in cell wall biosynthesis
MLKMIGRDVTVYWGGSHNSQPVPYVQCLSDAQQIGFFGEFDPKVLPVIEWDTRLPYWQEFDKNCIAAIRNRLQPGDRIALVGGSIHQHFIAQFPDTMFLEPGVGYEGIVKDGTFACYESYAWMHNRYGAYGIGDGRAFDAVIANAVDPADFEMGDDQGYALFVGRLIQRKGPNVAGEIVRALDMPLKVAGAGMASYTPNKQIVGTDGVTIDGNVEYVGAVAAEERKKLYAGASVMLVPTLYIGPWEGVHAEAMMSGVQVVAPDYGVFTETVAPEFRYRTLGEAVRATELAITNRGPHLREWAIETYSMEACAKMYSEWLTRLDLLPTPGWYG